MRDNLTTTCKQKRVLIAEPYIKATIVTNADNR